MTTATLDEKRSAEFAERMVQRINDAGTLLMVSIGHRTGLLDVLGAQAPSTSAELAAAAGLQERYVREWLGAMVAAGIVELDAATRRYALPAEHAAWLTRSARPNNLATTAQWVAVLGSVEDDVVRCFVQGGGVPYERFARFHRVMADESDQTVVAALDEHILPVVPGLDRRLERGIDVLDVGCGSGRAMVHLALRFPASRFTGFDLSPEAVAAARAEAKRRGAPNTRFEVRDVESLPEESFDLVTAFDAIHDQARPDLVLRAIHRALRPGGTFLMQDIKAHTDHAHNVGAPLASFVYAVSCMHCMTVSLERGGMGLGAAWGREKAVEMLAEAGFGRVEPRELPHDVLNDYYVAAKR